VNPATALNIKTAAEELKIQCHDASLAAGWWTDLKTGQPVQSNPMCFAQKLMPWKATART
jgi:hypothetical protein